MRCFIAIDIDPELRLKVENLQKGLADFDIKLVESYNLHFTLKFLGEIDAKTVEKVNTIITKIAAEFDPFEIDIKNVGYFPNENFIRVVWIGADLNKLQTSVNHGLSGLFKKERPNLHDAKRQSVSHLTIARIRSQRCIKEIKAFVNNNRLHEIGQMYVNAIKLKKSNVTQKGPIYEDLVTFNLGKRE